MWAPLIPPARRQWEMSDGYLLHGRVWEPAGRNASHAVIYLHGIQSHGGWFEWSASLLAQCGCAVILPDRRGSGLNNTQRGDTPSWQRWLGDIDELAEWSTTAFKTQYFDLVGVSWGGKPALAWSLKNPDRTRKILLIGPGLFPAVDVNWSTRLKIGRALLTDGSRQFEIPLNDPKLFTDNPAGQKFIASDQLKLTHATARFFWHSRQLDRFLFRTKQAVWRTKAVLLLAEHDRIIRNQPTLEWFGRVAGGSCRVVQLDNSSHTLEFDRDRRGFRKVVESWLANLSQAPYSA